MCVYGAQDLHGFAKVRIAGSKKRFVLGRWMGGLESAELGLVEIGLESGFDDV
jgi:hypothetical protein